jgi:hypothetical protein
MLHASQFRQPVAERLRVRRPKEIAALPKNNPKRRHLGAGRLCQVLDECCGGPFAAARLVSSRSGEDLRGIDITMVSTPAFVVSGTVVTTGGIPLSGAAVTLIVWPTTLPARAMTGVTTIAVSAERCVGSVPSGADGASSIANVPSGTYRMTASSPEFGRGALLQTSTTLTVDANLTGLKLIVSSVEPMISPALHPPGHRVSLAGSPDGEPLTLTFDTTESGPLSATLVFTSKPNVPVELAASRSQTRFI